VLVSIVLPVYNQAHYLGAAIDSVRGQTLRDWELLVVDDGSTDDVGGVIRRQDDPRLTLFSLPHRGLPQALNHGWVRARGTYLTWTSADNLLLPDMLAELVLVLEERPKSGSVYSDYALIDEDGNVTEKMSKGEHRLGLSTNFGPSFLLRGRIARKVGLFDEKLMGVEDRDHSVRMAMVAPVSWLPKVLYHYRVHDGSMTARFVNGTLDLGKSIARYNRKWRFFQDPYWRGLAYPQGGGSSR
jgi:glycosyltransferase involved in cell wall biosynthesis